MKITEYGKKTTLVNDNVFLLDGSEGTKTILAHDLANALLALMTPKEQVAKLNMASLDQMTAVGSSDRLLVGSGNSAKAITINDAFYGILDSCITLEQRRNIFRGKNLGTAYTAAQKAEVKAGTFKGLFIGDYWTIGEKVWRIVDMDYWWNCGDRACTTHHLVIMPDAALYNAQMNETNITTGGYVSSKMYTTNLENAKTTINSAFGTSNILTHRDLLVNAVTNGYPSGGAWLDSTVELANEIMMYGSYVRTPAGDGTVVPYRYTINKTQLALMRIHPKFINPGRYWYWLRDVVSAAYFAHVSDNGCANCYGAAGSGGVRPVFGIVG